MPYLAYNLYACSNLLDPEQKGIKHFGTWCSLIIFTKNYCKGISPGLVSRIE